MEILFPKLAPQAIEALDILQVALLFVIVIFFLRDKALRALRATVLEQGRRIAKLERAVRNLTRLHLEYGCKSAPTCPTWLRFGEDDWIIMEEEGDKA